MKNLTADDLIYLMVVASLCFVSVYGVIKVQNVKRDSDVHEERTAVCLTIHKMTEDYVKCLKEGQSSSP